MKSKFRTFLIIPLLLIVFGNCSGEDPANSAFVHVTMMDNVFHPPVIRTFKGGKIRFVNEGNNPHNAISVTKKWSTETSFGNLAMFRGSQTDVFFPEEGVFPYFCSFHASPDGKVGMTGVAVIGDVSYNPQTNISKSKISKKWTGIIRKVPSQYPTIQNAVDAASPGDMVYISKGVYKEEVVVTTPSLIIRGEDRNETIIDGEFLRGNGIMVVGADGVAVENITTRNATLNGVYWTGVKGYRGSYITAYNNGDYGVYAFDSVDGIMEHSYASGSPDSGFYIGQCNPCDAIIHDVVSEKNALGYSGTNASGNLYLLSSIWRENQLGIGPNTLDRELLPPQKQIVVKKNLVYNNNNTDAPSKKLEYPSIGNGIAILGGLENIVEENLVFNHKNYGILVTMNIDENIWISNNNIVKNNEVYHSGRGDIALSGPVNVGNCFQGNKFGVSSPPFLESLQSCSGIRYPHSGDLSSSIGLLALFVQANLREFELGSYKNQPVPPKQITMPKESLDKVIPAHDVFNSYKSLISSAELPKLTPEEWDKGKQSMYTSGWRVHFPGTLKTWYFHIIGFLLPFTIFIAWTGLSLLDRAFVWKKEGLDHYFWILLLIPFIGSLVYLYSKESKIPKTIRNSIVGFGVGFFFTILAFAIYAITAVAEV